MSNVKLVKRQPVTLTLSDGRERTFKYTLNAFAEMEDRYGSVQEAMDMLEKENMKAVIFMIWVGLIHEDEKLTEKQVGNLIEIQDLKEIAEKMQAVMATDLPESDNVVATVPNA